MLVFFHCHKVAGSTVVDAAKRSGMKFPPHRNGNPISADGSRIDWNTLTDDQIFDTLQSFKKQNVDFIAFEFNRPPWHVLSEVDGLEFFTIIREPLQRAWSNYNFAIRKGNVRKVNGQPISFSQYINRPNRDDFYVRFFTPVQKGTTPDLASLETSLTHLQKFAAVCVLEAEDITQSLETVGIPRQSFGPRRKQNPTYRGIDTAAHSRDVIDPWSYPWNADFYSRNQLDTMLYSVFLEQAKIRGNHQRESCHQLEREKNRLEAEKQRLEEQLAKRPITDRIFRRLKRLGEK